MRNKFSGYLRYGTCLLMVFLFLVLLILYFPGMNDDDERELSLNSRENHDDSKHLTEKEEKEEVRDETDNGTEYKKHSEEMFLGVHDKQIAVFVEDLSGNKILKEILPYKVKDIFYEELVRGIPFYSEEEKMMLLENYTS